MSLLHQQTLLMLIQSEDIELVVRHLQCHPYLVIVMAKTVITLLMTMGRLHALPTEGLSVATMLNNLRDQSERDIRAVLCLILLLNQHYFRMDYSRMKVKTIFWLICPDLEATQLIHSELPWIPP